jgi:hypothetical protein
MRPNIRPVARPAIRRRIRRPTRPRRTALTSPSRRAIRYRPRGETMAVTCGNAGVRGGYPPIRTMSLRGDRGQPYIHRRLHVRRVPAGRWVGAVSAAAAARLRGTHTAPTSGLPSLWTGGSKRQRTCLRVLAPSPTAAGQPHYCACPPIMQSRLCAR